MVMIGVILVSITYYVRFVKGVFFSGEWTLCVGFVGARLASPGYPIYPHFPGGASPAPTSVMLIYASK
jgi:hypothetical protein